MLFPRHVAKAPDITDRNMAGHVNGFVFIAALVAIAPGPALAQYDAAMRWPALADPIIS